MGDTTMDLGISLVKTENIRTEESVDALQSKTRKEGIAAPISVRSTLFPSGLYINNCFFPWVWSEVMLWPSLAAGEPI